MKRHTRDRLEHILLTIYRKRHQVLKLLRKLRRVHGTLIVILRAFGNGKTSSKDQGIHLYKDLDGITLLQTE